MFTFKGAVCRYCFDVKPFACFFMKCDVKCYDTCIKMADHGQQCTIMYVQALVMFFLAYNVCIDWREVLCAVEQ